MRSENASPAAQIPNRARWSHHDTSAYPALTVYRGFIVVRLTESLISCTSFTYHELPLLAPIFIPSPTCYRMMRRVLKFTAICQEILAQIMKYRVHFKSICDATALANLGRYFSFLICTQLVCLLGQGISKSQGRCLHTEQHKHRTEARRHPCLKWDSNQPPQCSRQRRRFMP
jgi:hypothetical protein